MTHGILDEGISVAIANEIAITGTLGDELKAQFDTFPPDFRASMYHDLKAGRPLELDDIVGVIVRLGEKLGVPTPLTFAAYASLKPYANGTPGHADRGRSAPDVITLVPTKREAEITS